jgi:hypothetical protein
MEEVITAQGLFNTVYFCTLFNYVSFFTVICIAMGLQEARLFFVFGIVAQACVGIVSVLTELVVVHRIAKGIEPTIKLLLITILLTFGASVIAYQEITVCYIEDYETFETNRVCAEFANGDTVASADAAKQCSGSGVDGPFVGGCVASQVSTNLIEVYRVLGLIASTLMLVQVVTCAVCAGILIRLAGTAKEEAECVSKLTLISLIAAGVYDPAALSTFQAVSPKLGGITADEIDMIIERISPQAKSDMYIPQQQQPGTGTRRLAAKPLNV